MDPLWLMTVLIHRRPSTRRGERRTVAADVSVCRLYSILRTPYGVQNTGRIEHISCRHYYSVELQVTRVSNSLEVLEISSVIGVPTVRGARYRQANTMHVIFGDLQQLSSRSAAYRNGMWCCRECVGVDVNRRQRPDPRYQFKTSRNRKDHRDRTSYPTPGPFISTAPPLRPLAMIDQSEVMQQVDFHLTTCICQSAHHESHRVLAILAATFWADQGLGLGLCIV